MWKGWLFEEEFFIIYGFIMIIEVFLCDVLEVIVEIVFKILFYFVIFFFENYVDLVK